ncbi:MAG: RagB/SusD family nutrient uptake outer membrane protein [Bacteroidota bacterium]
MKKKIVTLVYGLLVLTAFSCTDLNEEVYSGIPLDEFFRTEKDVLMNAGRAYTKLQGFPEEFSLWTLTEMASDEMVAPGRDDGWVWDNGRWDQIHKHNLSSTNKILTLAYGYVYEGISACNEVLYETETSTIEFEGKDKIIAEIKVLRALFYYWAIDNWGNVPFSVDFSDKSLPVQKDRAYVYDFLVDEITGNVAALQKDPEEAYYGRVTQGMAYTLLAKLYLNSQEWVGVPRWEEAAAACDSVIAIGAYQIEDDFFVNFSVNNEVSRENIFVIPMHSIYTKDNLYWYTLTLNDASRATFNFKGAMWDEFVLEPGFLDKYADNDVRKNSFLFGQQKDMNGKDIVIDGEPFIYTPEIEDYMARKKWEGARCCKYEYQPDLEYYVNDMENDFVIFRYADVLYTKLEALYRLGREGEMLSDPDLMKIRTRAGLEPYSGGELSDEEFLDELGREFAWEGHRRQDQIRFGVWARPWWNKPFSEETDKLFPIPVTVMNANPNLVQNPGY